MRPRLSLLLLLVTCALPAQSGERFAAVAFHDVVDFPGDLDDEAVTVDRLVAFFDWLLANRWNPISLDDVNAARLGKKPLPERPILITFDDAYRSVYTRVFPLALAYRIPIVVAAVGEWIDSPMDAKVHYGDREVPRSRFLSWEEMQQMSRSGLVEIASHSYGLHRGVPGNPQGNELAAATTRRYSHGGGYESEAAYRKRIAADLKKSRDLLDSRLGKAPRTIVWPFGRYSGDLVEVAKEQGYQFALTLDPEPSDVRTPFAISRYLPTNNPPLESLVSNLRFEDSLPAAQRLVALNPLEIWAGDSATMDERLGRIIERLRALGATGIVLDAVETNADGQLTFAWFPTSQLPVRADVLSRIAWQCQTRGGVESFVRLPASAALRTLGWREKVLTLFRELGVYVPTSGLFVDDTPGLARFGAAKSPAAARWDTEASREALKVNSLPGAEALTLAAFRAVENSRPRLQLVLVTDEKTVPRPAAIADLTLLQTAVRPHAVARLSERLKDAGWLAPGIARRCGLWFTSDRPPSARDLTAATRAFQIRGGTAIGWCKDDPLSDLPAAKSVSPTVSGLRFPVKF